MKTQKINGMDQKLRESTILKELEQKRNGVRMGTLLLLGIMETTQEAMQEDPAYIDAQIDIDREVFESLSIPE